MNIIKAFENAYMQKTEKKWDYIYVAIDIHGTIFKPTYSKNEIYDYYPYAKETLKLLTRRNDVKLILWTSSYFDIVQEYQNKFMEHGIYFKYVNENPEVSNTDLASFYFKFYFNVGLDDKFGFEPEIDWEKIYNYLISK